MFHLCRQKFAYVWKCRKKITEENASGSKRHSSCEQLLRPKKSKQIYLYRTKGTYCGYMGAVKKFNISTPFEGLVVLRLKYPPIWAEHANCYLLKECCFLIFLYSLMQSQYVPLVLYWQICLNFFLAQVIIAMSCGYWMHFPTTISLISSFSYTLKNVRYLTFCEVFLKSIKQKPYKM